MRAPVLVGFFINGGTSGRQPRHAGLTCRRCGGPVLKGWSCLGRACAQCSRPWWGWPAPLPPWPSGRR